MTGPAPRLFGIVAADAPIVAVIRRGPTAWCQVSRWDVAAGTVQEGSWFRGTIAPQKCDVSPDGRWFAYSAVKHPGDWQGGAVYNAVSKLPWLTALATWPAGTTYTRGIHFRDEPGTGRLGPPAAGRFPLTSLGLGLTEAAQFAVERRRGWKEGAHTPPRSRGGPWDEDRSVEMIKPRPDGDDVLHVRGAFAAFRTSPDLHVGCDYWLRRGDETIELRDGQWADWSHDGQLLVATDDGRLEARRTESAMEVTQRHDLRSSAPDPSPPPAEARRW